MIRILDKVMRMISLTDHDAVIKSESIQDTVEDLINYSTYWLQFKEEEAKKSITRPTQRDFEPNFGTRSFEKLKNLKKTIEDPVLTGEDVTKMLELTHICTCVGVRETTEKGKCKDCGKVVALFREAGEVYG